MTQVPLTRQENRRRQAAPAPYWAGSTIRAQLHCHDDISPLSELFVAGWHRLGPDHTISRSLNLRVERFSLQEGEAAGPGGISGFPRAQPTAGSHIDKAKPLFCGS